MPGVGVTTPRLVLRPFTEVDREPFFELRTYPARLGMVHDVDDFDHPGLPGGSPLRHHVPYRVNPSQLVSTLAP